MLEQPSAKRAPSFGYTYTAQAVLGTAAFASCDDAFGPLAVGCRNGRLDFTLLFEQTLFTIVPSALFMLGAIVVIFRLWGQKPKVHVTRRYYLKMTICFTLAAIKAVLLAQWIQLRPSLPVGTVSVAAATVSVADTGFLALLTGLSHMRSITPSKLIIIFTFFSVLLDSFRYRTILMVDELAPLTYTFAAGIAAKLVVFGLEAKSKRSVMVGDWSEMGAEETSSIVGQLFLWWVNPILQIGSASFLEPSDLPRLKPEQRARYLLPRMLQNWEKYKDSGKFALAFMVLNSCRSTVIAAGIPRLVLSVVRLLVPLYIKTVIQYATRQDKDSQVAKNTGYALIAKARMRVMMRTSLIATILHFGAQMEPGEKKGSAALTLITVDVNRIAVSFFFIHDFWIAPLETAFAFWLLAGQVGWGSLGPLITIIFGAIISGVCAVYVPNAQKKVNEAIEKRVSDTTTVIGHMKETKMLGLVDSWFMAIKKLMDNEIRQSLVFRRLMVVLNVSSKLPASLAPPLTFGIAILLTKAGERLSVAEAFTSISIMSLIIGPISLMAHMYPFIIAALPCFVRIQEFLKLCSDYEARVALVGSSAELSTAGDLLPEFAKPVFSMTNSDITSKSRGEPLLKGVTLKILPTTFNVVAGKVGSGKSVLLQALLGQLNVSGDTKVRTSNVAYCSQQPWIISGTAKDNIVCKSQPDEAWYNAVVTACGLDRDFEDFPQGDTTTVGTKGVSLSGGQKQRISLARGIFSRKPVVVVDDVLSGLDWATQHFVWDQVFGPSGLLRKNGVTAVLATHALHLIDQPDSVILLGDDGPSSAVQGTLDQLKATTRVQDLIATSHKFADDEIANTSSASSQKGIGEQTSTVNEAEKTKDLIRKTGDVTLYSYYLKMVDRKVAVLACIAAIASATWPVLPVLWLKWWTEANESPMPVNTAYYYSVYVLVNVMEIIIILGTFYIALIYVAPTALRKIHTRLLRATMSAPLSFFVATPPGDLVNRFSRDIEQIDLELPLNLTFTFMAVIWLMSVVALILVGSLYMAVIIAPMMVFIYVLQKYYLQTSRQLRYLDIQSSAPVNTHIIEMIDGVATVQAYGWESHYQATGMDLLDETMRPNYMMRIIQLWLELVLDVFVAFVCITLIVVCITIPSSTSPGALGVALTNVTTLGDSLAWLVLSFTSTETALGSVERIRSFETKTPRELPPANPQRLPPTWPSKGAVRFNSVTASYPPKGNNPAFRALKDIDVDIKPGQKVAICGRTGSGKSSLLLTLFRLLDLESGSITIDNVNIMDVAQNVLRPRLVSVPQEPMLLPGSLRSNLVRNSNESTKGDEVDELDDEKLINYLKIVELWDLVEGQGGLDGDAADLKLSQGQKQLVCMARALASKDESSVLVLDEAMSTVDRQTEELMVKILEDHFVEHTIISVVHRLNTVEKFDTVLLLDAGEVVEAGSPETLLAKEDGRFRALWHGKEA
ncbi:ABC transporter, transmembrane domain, type 1 [Beauveria brongniartii RCEF 3172]|uniref:ABC transporter, transmembrane domain, type 1 n=1 Tax=Beauveria brongniartii RCEF 3172 TaxID=1081107 RepID=A0A166Y440_9HYPO|nr:ABC transporter, transmembrane domain, type 1 [Beauveria brongniartii RCEF 3172]